MAYLVFAQLAEPTVPFEALQGYARAHFQAKLTRDAAPEHQLAGTARIHMSGPLGLGDFLVSPRPAESKDYERARTAELRSHAAGMAGLAMRCHTVFVVESNPETPRSVVLELCALLAAVGLGPILPPDDSTLLGVRSARERAAHR